MRRISKLMLFCNEHYSKKKMAHALRVAAYALEKARENKLNETQAYIIGLAHDLIEDTDCDQGELGDIIGDEAFDAVLLLTKADTETYEEYIENILKCRDKMVFLVKQADMKDHMAQVDTLTDKLKNKYIPVLHYFL